MHKKSQAQGTVFVYILAVLIVGIIFLVGFNVIRQSSNKLCQTQAIMFKNDMSLLGENLRLGDTKTKVLSVPCNANKLIVVDPSVEPSSLLLADYPLIIDSIESKSYNAFLYEGNSQKSSFKLDNLVLDFPYYECYQAINKKIKITLESKKDKIRLINDDERYSCNSLNRLPLELKNEDINALLKEISDNYVELSQSDILNAEKIRQCNLTRNFQEGADKTTIVITNKNCDATLYEKIPKCAVESLKDALASGLIHFSDDAKMSILNNDPLVMWDFSASDKDYSYTIKKLLEEPCKREFKALATTRKDITPADVSNQISLANPTIQPSLASLSASIPTLSDIDSKKYLSKIENLAKKIAEWQAEADTAKKIKLQDQIKDKVEDFSEKVSKDNKLSGLQQATITSNLNKLKTDLSLS